MKKTTKIILEALTVVILLSVVLTGVFSSAAATDDPADSYVVQTAANEDSSLSMWFDHSFRKTFTSDTVSTGKNTYSIYMAKNEIESAQVVLYSETDKTGMDISVTDFTDGKGHTVPAELYYEMYVTTDKLNTSYVLGATAEDTIIRAGETPDPIMPYSAVARPKKPTSFKLNAGKSQAFLIRAKSAEDTAPGWYSAQLNVYDADGNQVKTATVYCHVWDFVISDKTELQTAFYLSNKTSYGGSYQDFYDYLLENRLNAMDVPGGTITSSNPYLTNPRVAAVRVSAAGCGSASIPGYMDGTIQYPEYVSIYEDLSASSSWDEIKDKLYFYTVDEPTSLEQHDAIRLSQPNFTGVTIDDVKFASNYLKHYWPDANTVVPYHEDHPYPYYSYPDNPQNYSYGERRDATEELLNTGTVTTWCPQIYAFTPRSELDAVNYQGGENTYIRELGCTISGVYCAGPKGTNVFGSPYVDWTEQFGEFHDRVLSHQIVENAKGGNYRLWAYSAGWNKGYTYCNHLIENTGLQTKLLFWQLFQNDVTGYLYYGTNNWTEYTNESDKTVTGSRSGTMWYTNRHDYPTGYSIYGNGTLLYGTSMAMVSSVRVVGSLRVEILRDGVEEYQMLRMLSDLKGNKAAKDVVSEVSTNVVNYLSLNNFSTSAWGNADDYDIMETVRRNLGDAVEAASKEACAHTWDEGVETKAATCKAMGETTYTCTACGAVRTEYIPAKHSIQENFTEVRGTHATCTTNGKIIYKCKFCDYEKSLEETAFHNDETKWTYVSKNDTAHTVKCSVCGTVLNSAESHRMLHEKRAPTCTEAGTEGDYCRQCEYEANVIEGEPATGHNYDKGYCTVCGEKDPDYKTYTPGDLNSDGKINAADVTLLKKIIVGKSARVDAADVDGDTKVTSSDVVLLKKKIVGKA